MVAAVAVISFLMPKTYEATAVVLPEEKESMSGGELKAAFLEQFGLSGLGEGAATPAEVFEAILKSKELSIDWNQHSWIVFIFIHLLILSPLDQYSGINTLSRQKVNRKYRKNAKKIFSAKNSHRLYEGKYNIIDWFTDEYNGDKKIKRLLI